MTHISMYIGWPRIWAVFRLAKDVLNDSIEALTEKDQYQQTIFFPIGEPNDGFADYHVRECGT